MHTLTFIILESLLDTLRRSIGLYILFNYILNQVFIDFPSVTIYLCILIVIALKFTIKNKFLKITYDY